MRPGVGIVGRSAPGFEHQQRGQVNGLLAVARRAQESVYKRCPTLIQALVGGVQLIGLCSQCADFSRLVQSAVLELAVLLAGPRQLVQRLAAAPLLRRDLCECFAPALGTFDRCVQRAPPFLECLGFQRAAIVFLLQRRALAIEQGVVALEPARLVVQPSLLLELTREFARQLVDLQAQRVGACDLGQRASWHCRGCLPGLRRRGQRRARPAGQFHCRGRFLARARFFQQARQSPIVCFTCIALCLQRGGQHRQRRGRSLKLAHALGEISLLLFEAGELLVQGFLQRLQSLAEQRLYGRRHLCSLYRCLDHLEYARLHADDRSAAVLCSLPEAAQLAAAPVGLDATRCDHRYQYRGMHEAPPFASSRLRYAGAYNRRSIDSRRRRSRIQAAQRQRAWTSR